MELGRARVEACIFDINLWMVQNRLNQGKTEVLVFSSSYRHKPGLHGLTIVEEIVSFSSTAEDIGVVLDDSIAMVPHITAVCKSAFFHLRTISLIRSFLRLKLQKLWHKPL